MRFVKLQGPVPAILLLAFLVRAFMALRFQNIMAPDEIFQALEPAHRLVFGQGIVPWEFTVGLRNWLIPLLLAAPMALMNLLGASPFIGLLFIKLLLCVASLPIVWCAMQWGGRFYGARGVWISGLLTALWPDLWLMAPHPLEEVLSADILVPAIYLVGVATDLRRVAWAGFLLGVAFTFRMQLAPAIAVAGIALCGAAPRRWLTALAAAGLPFLLAGLLDWYAWGQPFRSFWLNIYINISLHVADLFGSEPFSFFIATLWSDWLWALPVFLILAWIGAKKLPLPGLVAAVIFVTHSLISHKEYRFIFPAVALATPLVGIGVAAVFAERKVRPLYVFGLCLALCGPLVSHWTTFLLGFQKSSLEAFETLAPQHVRVVSLQGWTGNFLQTLPFDLAYGSKTAVTLSAQYPGGQADAIVAVRGVTTIPADFVQMKCLPGTWVPYQKAPQPDICVWLRQGDTVADNAAPPALPLPFPPAAKPYIIRDRMTD